MIPLWQVAINSDMRVAQVTAWDRNGIRATGDAAPDYDEICRYGSSYKQVSTSFTRNSVTSTIVATDLAERTTFVPTGNINQITPLEATGASPAFKPTWLIGVALPAGYKEDIKCAYEFEIAFDLVFRGTRTDNAAAN